MRPRLVLHVGYPKTGTTSLQHFCVVNDTLLRRHELLYPRTGRINVAHYGFSFRMGFGSYDRIEELPPLNQLVADLHHELSNAGLSRALLSSEFFILASAPETVRDVFKDFDVTALFYLRRHDRVWESAYGQSLQSTPAPGWDPTIESYVLHQIASSPIPYDYLATLRRWAGVFGKANIVVRPFGESAGGDALYVDFLGALGVETDGPLQLPGRTNPSASYKTLIAIDMVQRSAVPAPFRRAIVLKLLQADAALERPDRTELLSPRNRVSIVERYRPMYAAIAREFLGRANGLLFAEAVPHREQPWVGPTEPTHRELAEMLLQAASSLVTLADRQATPPGAAKPE